MMQWTQEIWNFAHGLLQKIKNNEKYSRKKGFSVNLSFQYSHVNVDVDDAYFIMLGI